MFDRGLSGLNISLEWALLGFRALGVRFLGTAVYGPGFRRWGLR